MKKKTFRKLIAGASAVAMLSTAMPMTLIADAYSYNNASKMDTTGFAAWMADLDTDPEQTTGTHKFNGKGNAAVAFSSLVGVNLDDFNIRDVAKYQINEVYSTTPVVSGTSATISNQLESVVYDVAQAKKDIIAKVKDVTDVEFDMNEKLADGVSANPNYGKIKTITINMPVNGGNGTAKAMKFEKITFTVIRSASELVAASDGNFKDANGKTHIILAADLDVTGLTQEVTDAQSDLTSATTAKNTAKTNYEKAVLDKALGEATAAIIATADGSTAETDNQAGFEGLIDSIVELTEITNANADTDVTDAIAEIENLNVTPAVPASPTAEEAFKIAVYNSVIYRLNALDADNDGNTEITDAITEAMVAANTIIDSAKGTSFNTSVALTLGDIDVTSDISDLGDAIDTTKATYIGATGTVEAPAAGSALKAYNDAKVAYDAAVAASGAIADQISFAADVDINLNGCRLDTNAGVQVLGAKMRIWSGEITSKNDYERDGDKFSTLAGFTKSSIIELYDNVIINSKGTDTTKAVISSEGTVTVCGDAVTVKRNTQTSGTAIVLEEGGAFIAGDNDYSISDGAFAEVSNSNDPKAAGTWNFISKAIHKFNENGFEHYNGSTTTDYVDQDLRTTAIDYAFQPAFIRGTTTQATAGTNLNLDIKNIGQLYWVAQHINEGDYDATDVNIKIMGELDFSNSPKGLTWTPIDASATDSLSIDGAYTSTSGTNISKGYSVLKNLTVDVKTGNAGFIAKSKAGTITNIGVEGGTFKTADKTAYESAFIGQANSGRITNVYVKEAKLTGSGKKGALVGNLNSAEIDHTFTAADCDAVNSVTGDAAKNYLVINGKRQVMGYTNFYDSTRLAAAAAANRSGETKAYFMEATTADFKSGKVAFMLNGHSTEQVIAAASLVEWGTNGINDGSSSVSTGNYPADALGTKEYSDDIFGQVLDGTKAEAYPSFIKGITNTTAEYSGNSSDFTVAGIAKATNRVFRKIEMTCDGTRTEWTKANAKFANTEVDVTTSHATNGSGRCKNCGAYEITTTNFDASLLPFLSNLTDYGYTKAPSDDKQWLTLSTIGSMTKIVIDLTGEKTNKVPELVKKINDTTTNTSGKHSALKGLDTLNKAYTSGKELAATDNLITHINFIVSDSIICHTYSNDETKTLGFMVANAADGAFAVMSNPTLNMANTGTKVESNVAISDETIYNDPTNKNFYVAADKESSVAVEYATFKNVPATYGTATGTNDDPNLYNFIIKFEGGVKHNDVDDYDPSTGKGDKKWKASSLTFVNTNAEIHTISNDTCGCEWTEAHNAHYVITNTGHQGECAVCDRPSGDGFTSGTPAEMDPTSTHFEAHVFETVFTSGNLTLNRCTVCGYTAFTNHAGIAFKSDKPELSRPVGSDGTQKYRQAYTFQIAAGDDTIVQYGIIASKDAKKHIDKDKLAAAASGKYFDNNSDLALNTAELTDDGLSSTAKKAIKTSGEYTLNASLDNVDDTIELCGYVISKTADGTFNVAVTSIVKNSFYEAAQLEAENYCSIDGNVTPEASRKAYSYDMEVSGGFAVKTYGMIYSKSSTTPVTNNTALADVTGTIAKTDRAGKFPAGSQAIQYNQGISGTIGDISSRGYLTVTNPKFGSDVELTIYTDVE